MVDANLNRRNSAGAIVPWVLNADGDNPNAALSDPVIEHGLRSRIGALADAAWTTGSGSVIAILKGIYSRLTTINTTLTDGSLRGTVNATISDGSGPVTVDGTVAVTGVATEATLSALYGALDTVESTLSTLATNLTLNALLSKTSGDQATNATLTQVRDRLPLTGIATESSLSALSAIVGSVLDTSTAQTLLGRLAQIKEATDGVEALIGTTNTALGLIRDDIEEMRARTSTLMARMMAKVPFDSTYRLWIDTANANYIYVAENVAGTATSDASFDGIRIPKDASGNILGGAQQKVDFAWDSRTDDTGWS